MSVGKPLVLLVEDDEDIRSSLQDLLLDEGYAVQVAHDGTEALELLRADFEPECIVLDLMMPQMDGFALLDVLRGPEAEPVRGDRLLRGRFRERLARAAPLPQAVPRGGARGRHRGGAGTLSGEDGPSADG